MDCGSLDIVGVGLLVMLWVVCYCVSFVTVPCLLGVAPQLLVGLLGGVALVCYEVFMFAGLVLIVSLLCGLFNVWFAV